MPPTAALAGGKDMRQMLLINVTIVHLNSFIRYILQCTSSQVMAVENIPVYPCDFQANTTNDLRTHQKSVDIEEKFKCDQCDIYFSHKESISKHKQSIQEMSMYP